MVIKFRCPESGSTTYSLSKEEVVTFYTQTQDADPAVIEAMLQGDWFQMCVVDETRVGILEDLIRGCDLVITTTPLDN